MSKETMNEARAVISAETPDWPGALIVASGELDVQSVPELRERLAEAIDAGNRSIVVDMSEVSFIDSLSLSALVGARRKLGDDGHLAIVATRDDAVAFVRD